MKLIVEIEATKRGEEGVYGYNPYGRESADRGDIFHAIAEKLIEKGFKIKTLSIEDYSDKCADSGDE